MRDGGNSRARIGTPVDYPLFGVAQRVPPANLQAEQALLGAIFANNRAMDSADFLRPEHFADPVHGRIFQECRTLIEAGRIADAVTLNTIFANTGVLADVGGTAYLAQLLTAMVGINNAGDYAHVIRDAWVRRQVIAIGCDAVDNAFGVRTEMNGEAAVTDAIDRLMALGEETTANEAATVDEAIEQALQSAERAAKGEERGGLMTGIQALDELWDGLWPDCLDFLAARSEHGKTALGMQIATYVARTLLAEHEEIIAAGLRHPLEHVDIYSLEMPRDHLALRMLASETGIAAREIRAGRISGARAKALIAARAELRGLPMIIHDKPGMTLSEIAMSARATKRRKRTRLIVIDHLHRIAPDPSKRGVPRNEQVQGMTAALKNLARSLHTPILLLAQLSRRSDQREDNRPVVADIEYAGERDADNICLLWRPELYFGAQPPTLPDRMAGDKKAEATEAWYRRKDAVRGKAEVILAKKRMGAVGSAWLNFDGPRTRFSPATHADPQGECFDE